MLRIHYSNRLEILAEGLAALLGTPAGAPLAAEWVAVQNIGTARWLSLEIARHSGVCANTRFLLPAELVWRVLAGTLGEVPAESTYDAATLSWRVLGVLDGTGADGLGAQVARYLADKDPLKRYGLARRLAGVLEQYLVFRPDWIRQWEAESVSDWQCRLWRRLVESGEPRHWVRLHDEFLGRAEAGALDVAGLPARIALFGITTLSPAYLEVLRNLAAFIDVHLYVLNPCREYWGDIVTAKDQARRAERAPEDALYLEVGNALLACLGKQGRDFIDQLQVLEAAEAEAFVAPGEDSLLHAIQTDILELRTVDADSERRVIDAADRSLQVHACHSAMREVEVLHDQLLSLFETDLDLSPSDVVVMTPDIETYAPYIDAVFGARDDQRRIPYTLADRSLGAESPLVQGLFQLLELPASRFEANAVLAPLELRAVQRRFGFADEDLELIHRWVRDTRVRWGMDGASRGELELPATDEHSWRAGVDRLLVGYAMSERGDALFEGVLPYAAIEGADAQTAGRLQTYLDALAELRALCRRQRSVADWVALLQELLSRFFDVDDDEEPDLRLVREGLAAMGEVVARAGYHAPVALDVVKAELRERLERPGAGGRFLAGAVTFCALAPMRSIPFQVVCLIGMNDGSFPRSHKPYSFDRMANQFRPGDRSRRFDDRYLFLETLISARKALYLSYVGRDIRDDSVIPPAVVVSELLDYVAAGFRLDNGGDVIAENVTVQHPLQAFSPRYFTGVPRLFSYAAELARAGETALRHSERRAPLFGEPLPAAEEQWRQVTIAQLVRFLHGPARYLLQERLGVYLEEGAAVIETREPFDLERRAQNEIRAELLGRMLGGAEVNDVRGRARAAGLLPHGAPGDVLFADEVQAAHEFVERLRPHLPAEALPPQRVELELGDMRLVGQLGGIGAGGLVDYRLRRMYASDWLELWVRHLVLNCLDVDAQPRSVFVAADEEVVLGPAREARALLGELLGLYWHGLHRPLPFFPRSALDYVRKDGSMSAALKAWEPNEFAVGASESEESYNQLVFGADHVLDQDFERLAQMIFGPLLAHAGEG